MKKLTVPSFAKLNLFLRVLSKRRDGYHSIQSIFERIDLFDTLIFALRKDSRISISSDSNQLPRTSEKNLVYQSARLLQEYCRVSLGADIRIIKRIPVGAGMGGGSSNAGATLLALNKLWGLRLSRRELLLLAARIGSDVPFFVCGSPFAEVSGRGERIKPLLRLSKRVLWHVVVVPRIMVPTPAIYRAWDKLPEKLKRGTRGSLTRKKYNVKITHLALEKGDYRLLENALFNSLQDVTRSLYPAVRRVEEALAAAGCRSVLMSGSGPSVFGICSSRKEAFTLLRRITKSNRRWRVFAVRTR